ncbi:recombinase family protein [Micromonospora sp. WMMD980]|uniref:recombinase family protein n=1 Tax=Micromonospora sp. WMMD980 TaxID=3016088 RepID=UPI0024169B92|nr:recombinase family protein [Micromonospora sp. WMMD980]MDG4799919.1 recombinase family protein [Micromonospora sp. WMMD980]
MSDNPHDDLDAPLTRWLSSQPQADPQPPHQRRRGLRFAFYGRMSTVEHQDRVTSRHWQWDCAIELVAAHGVIVAEYFDIGCSRRRSWRQRPQAAALLAALDDPDRGFDAIVIGEYERAFSTNQLQHLAPVLEQHGVQLWLPEMHGPVDHQNPTHQALIMMLGAQSKREVQRARFRVVTAMRAQAREQGRYLGGRPPYGYRLVDAGPHPNTAHARWGRRLQSLEPDPATAAHVRWIFTQRLDGHSLASIARALNDASTPCPSNVDPDRNPHRNGNWWTLRTVAAILANPRYTGRQVWNRQPAHTDTSSPQREPLRRNPTKDWVVSTHQAHTALVSEQDFVAAQAIRSHRSAHDGTTRRYLFTGLLRCGPCGRRLESHWVNQRPGYRCRHGRTSTQQTTNPRRKILYLREDHIIARLADHPLLPSGIQAPHDLVTLLRSKKITIVCDQEHCTPTTE